jgi:pimeloyl-ACP methyl ester carboxylesterase
MNEHPMRSVETDALKIAYVEYGPSNGWPVIQSHGFPYDVHAFDDVAPILAGAGARVIAPYTRGFGPTRFVSDDVMRSGQQAARGADIIQLAAAHDLFEGCAHVGVASILTQTRHDAEDRVAPLAECYKIVETLEDLSRLCVTDDGTKRKRAVRFVRLDI